MAGTQPQAQIASTPTNWQCHKCNGGPHVYANTTRCTNITSNNHPCGHDFCHEFCRKDSEIRPPLSSADSSLPRLRSSRPQLGSTSPTMWLDSTTGLASHRHIHRAASSPASLQPDNLSQRPDYSQSAQRRQSTVYHHHSMSGSRPSMARWWKCGNCVHMNNSVLHTGRCWHCGHAGPCRCCKQY
jgi:hypothetical protein